MIIIYQNNELEYEAMRNVSINFSKIIMQIN